MAETGLLFLLEKSLRQLIGVLAVLLAYWDILLFRCAIVSVVLLAAALLARALIPARCTWLRAAVWSVFLLAPFFGRLRLWYDDPFIRRTFWFIHTGFIVPLAVRFLYPLPALVLLAIRVVRELRLLRMVRRLPRLDGKAHGADVRVMPLSVSPFSCGLLSPHIVIPAQFTERLSQADLEEILLHERTHIRLGHLWIFFLWDILCAMLYPNILLRLAARLLREDLEAVCDRATIQAGRCNADAYGRLILRSIRLTAADADYSPAALLGEHSFAETKRRMRRVCGFTPYRTAGCAALLVSCLLLVGAAFAGLKHLSYRRWEQNRLVTIADLTDGELHTRTFVDETAIARAISYDKETLTIDRAAFEELRRTEGGGGVDPEHFYIVFDCFYKLPGIGGGGQLVEVDFTGEEDILHIPYEWTSDVWTEAFRIL